MTLPELNAEIALTRKHLCDLNKRRDAILAKRRAQEKARNRKMLKLFDDEGLDSVEIGRKLKLSDTMVRQFLWARGRTKRGRQAIRSQMIITNSGVLHSPQTKADASLPAPTSAEASVRPACVSAEPERAL